MKQHVLEKLYQFLYRFQRKTFTFFLSPCFHSIGKKSSIMPPFHFFNLKEVKIGSNVVIHPRCWIQGLDVATSNNCPKLIIGDNSSIGMDSIISAAYSIIIGENVLIAPKVYISDYGHEFQDTSIPISKQGIRKITEIKIGDGSWIGYNAILLPGAQIGKNCIIGAHAVVNTIIPDFSLAVGSPAQIISSYSKEHKTWEKRSTTKHD
jgi:acetyltransferase-like isoleucine patch superfamily enzyme